MKPMIALLRETWWFWLGCLAACVAMVYYLHTFFLVLLPMLLVVFVYFSYMRFDLDGQPKNL